MIEVGSKEYNKLGEIIDEIDNELYDQWKKTRECYDALFEMVGLCISSNYEIEDKCLTDTIVGVNFRKEFTKFESMWFNSNDFYENFEEEYEVEDEGFLTEGLRVTLNDTSFELGYWQKVNKSIMDTIVERINDHTKIAERCWEKACELIEDKCGIYVDWDLFNGVNYYRPRDKKGNVVKNETCRTLAYYTPTSKKIWLNKYAILHNEEDEIIKILCHEICHWLCHRWFKLEEAYDDNSVVFAMMINFLNKHIGFKTNCNQLDANITQNRNYAYEFRTQYKDLWKIAIDGRRNWYTVKKFIKNYIAEHEDLRIIPED